MVAIPLFGKTGAGFGTVLRCCLLSTLLLAVPSVAQQPGDPLPAEEDTASYKDCGTPVMASGSQIIRVVSAGPRREDGSLAFVPGICVYLPPGYADGTKRYPVIYSLHGGSGRQGVGFDEHMDRLALDDPSNAVIVVGPDGSGLGAWFDRFDNNNTSVQNLGYQEQGAAHGRSLNETYVLDWVIPFIDKHFRTIPTREGRALFGISNGGHGSMLLAAKRPDLVAVAASMSGNVAWGSLSASHELFLDPETGEYSPAYRAGNIPANLTTNLEYVDLIFDIGTTCPESAPWCYGYWSFEQLFVQGNRELQASLRAVGHIGDNDYRETEGGHDIQWWEPWFVERHLPFMLERLADPQPVNSDIHEAPTPEFFRYRSISAEFSVYGYTFAVERDVREFVDIEVTPSGLSIRGSGKVSVLTPPRYRPAVVYSVLGHNQDALPEPVAADPSGRLRIEFDLGPSNQQENLGHHGDTGAPIPASPLAPLARPQPFVARTATITSPHGLRDSSNGLDDETSAAGGVSGPLMVLVLALLAAVRRRSS